jgi:autotransporter adhesin
LAVAGATITNGISNTGDVKTTTLTTTGAASIGGGLNLNGNVISNVKAGVAATDAINKGQFDSAVSTLGSSITALDKKMSAGVASAAALSALPSVGAGKHFAVGVAAAGFNSQSAIAIGIQGRSQDDVIQMRAGVGYSQSKATISGGVGYSW